MQTHLSLLLFGHYIADQDFGWAGYEIIQDMSTAGYRESMVLEECLRNHYPRRSVPGDDE